ncbi:putative secreted protein [Phyllobacterium myrsinacearum]|uniref:Putative secreted protein n=2 Tax=Phyllobacterium myrsinacearum TaxID=28101 RepID=A0A839EHP5_9HYPH|nr:putative secreted protein [Phyllobacterium myrsinacearum]
MMRAFSLLGAALVLVASSWSFAAQAGDVAKLDILGFSKDGKVFAFEEYGVQDGSGFPYANRYYIDTATDTFLPKTPVRVRLDDEKASLADAREKVGRDAQGLTGFADAELRTNAGDTVAANPVTELSADKFKVMFNPRPVFPAMDEPITAMLDEIDVPRPDKCPEPEPYKGFRLTIKQGQSADIKTLHEDKTIPASRSCPQGYSIGAVQTFYLSDGKPALAVLIAVRTLGFEGPDYRWLAVTTQQ